MDKLEREAFEAKVREAVVARMVELQFGSKGPLKRSMYAVGKRVSQMGNQTNAIDQQLARTMQEVQGMIKAWKGTAKAARRGGKSGAPPNITREMEQSLRHLDTASGHIGQAVEAFQDAANALT